MTFDDITVDDLFDMCMAFKRRCDVVEHENELLKKENNLLYLQLDDRDKF